MNKPFVSSCPLFASDIRNYMFHIPFILFYHEKTNILEAKGGQKYKKIPRLYSGAMKI